MPAAGRLGDKAQVQSDAHGCPACPHTSVGPAILGSSDVFVNNKPVLRVGDNGIATPCCGPNIWSAQKGATTVLINNQNAFRKDDPSQHCGGSGKLIEGSPDVEIGDSSPGDAGQKSGAGPAPGSGAETAATVRDAQSAASAAANTAQSAPPPIDASRASVEDSLLPEDTLVVECLFEGWPIAGWRFVYVDAAGQRHEGETDETGTFVLRGLAPGEGYFDE